MTISSCDANAAACDLLVRLLVANRLPLDLFETVVGFTPDAVAAVLAGAAVPLWPGERETLALLAAILVRLEIRSGYDARIVRQLLDTPQPGLDGATPLAAMATGPDGLRAVHRLVGDIALPAERWWRVAPRRWEGRAKASGGCAGGDETEDEAKFQRSGSTLQ